MLLHAATATALATGLGIAARHHDLNLPGPARWLVCATFAVYFTVGLLAALPSRPGPGPGPGPGWITGWALPCTLTPLALAA